MTGFGAILATKATMESELERRVRERTAELEYANAVLRERTRMLSAELEAVQHIATQLISVRGVDALYEQILDTVVALVHADFAVSRFFTPGVGRTENFGSSDIGDSARKPPKPGSGLTTMLPPPVVRLYVLTGGSSCQMFGIAVS
jgi:hypothetical protein